MRDHVLVGHADGAVRLWRVFPGAGSGGAHETPPQLVLCVHGHRSVVTCFAVCGEKVASGSLDTDVVLWDLEAGAGVCRLRGHRGAVTGVQFLGRGSSSGDRLASCAKDKTLKVWDVATQVATHSMSMSI